MAEVKNKGCLLCRLGRITYPEAVSLQQQLVEDRHEQRVGDIVLLLEHPPTITLGRHARRENVLLNENELRKIGIAMYPSNRGGDVTFHCPGQLGVYPIMDLRERPGFLRGYIRDLEETALRVLADYGINAERWEEHPGLWVDAKQIGAIGLRISHGISMHGLALNVCPDLKSFEVINLCGLPGMTAASIASETGRYDISMNEAEKLLIRCFSNVFHVELIPARRKELQGGRVEPETARMV